MVVRVKKAPREMLKIDTRPLKQVFGLMQASPGRKRPKINLAPLKFLEKEDGDGSESDDTR